MKLASLVVSHQMVFFFHYVFTGLAAIIGAVLGVIVGIAAVGLLVCCIKKKRWVHFILKAVVSRI